MFSFRVMLCFPRDVLQPSLVHTLPLSSRPSLSVCLSVCLTVCEKDYSKKCGSIFVQYLRGGWSLEYNKKRVDCGCDLNVDSAICFV